MAEDSKDQCICEAIRYSDGTVTPGEHPLCPVHGDPELRAAVAGQG